MSAQEGFLICHLNISDLCDFPVHKRKILRIYSPNPMCSFGDGISYPTRCSGGNGDEEDMMQSLLGGEDGGRQEFEFVNETFLANTQ